MATNELMVDAPPAAVWAVLADAEQYEDWVVGSSDIRSVEGGWPAPRAHFHHTQFVPRIGIKDTTTVLSSSDRRQLVLRVRARPLVEAEVRLDLEPIGQGTKVTMRERPVGGLARLVPRPLVDVGLRLRNAESLRRLRALAEDRRQRS